MAGLLTAAELAACRAQQVASFDLVATQQRAADDGWGTIAGPTTIGTLPCRLAPMKAHELQQIVAQVGNVTAWWFTCADDADLRQEDLLIIGSDTYRVNSVQTPASYSTANRAVVTEVR
jgi:hypothetical protein